MQKNSNSASCDSINLAATQTRMLSVIAALSTRRSGLNRPASFSRFVSFGPTLSKGKATTANHVKSDGRDTPTSTAPVEALPELSKFSVATTRLAVRKLLPALRAVANSLLNDSSNHSRTPRLLISFSRQSPTSPPTETHYSLSAPFPPSCETQSFLVALPHISLCPDPLLRPACITRRVLSNLY